MATEYCNDGFGFLYPWYLLVDNYCVDYNDMPSSFSQNEILPVPKSSVGKTTSHLWQKHYLHVMLNFCNFTLTFGKLISFEK